MIKLSIIIPAYNPEPYLSELIEGLAKQITSEVEVIVIDDGSSQPIETSQDYCWVHIVHKDNGGCASARNKGIDLAQGLYVAFVDSDDILSENYISKVLDVINAENPDVIEMSWKSLNDTQKGYKLKNYEDRLPNSAVWCRVIKRSFIGDSRFNELKDSTEDEDFTRHIGIRDKEINYKRATITDYLYFYRDVENSKIKRFKQGLMKTKRVTYHFKEVTPDRIDILEQIKEDDKRNEVLLITDKCEIPELYRYCQIFKSIHTWTHYHKGEPYEGIEILSPKE